MKRFRLFAHYSVMKKRLGVLLAALVVVPAVQAATCPFNIPVVTLPPQQINGFSWGAVIRPLGDACVSSIAVEPSNDAEWYVGGQNGLYMTKNNGGTWKKALNGTVGALYMTHVPGQLVYAGIGPDLYLTRDHGQNWTKIRTFTATVRSLLVNPATGTLYIGLGWDTHAMPSGVFTANLGAGLPQFHPFGPGQTGLIVWTLSRDPISGAIYAGTEIFDHPQPYHPPTFRSDTNGNTWLNITGILPWHVIASAVRPNDGFVYALTEGAGLFVSATKGQPWHPAAKNPVPSDSLLMDPKHPTHLFGGRVKFGNDPGGLFASIDAGQTFKPIGLKGVTVAGLALNGASTKIYATTYGSGIYVSPVP